MESYALYLLPLAGFIAGFINTVAGGGSLLTLPILISMGLPPQVANGTNRVAILSQNFFATRGFISKGIWEYPYNVWLGISATIGAILGAKLAGFVDGELFKKIFAAIMVLVVVNMVFKPFKKKMAVVVERMSTKAKWQGIVAFFFVGIYGGFIQAGVGIIIMVVLEGINRLSLVKINSIKTMVVLIFTGAALFVFAMDGLVNWKYGVVLAVGNSLGGWFASRWSVSKGDKYIRIFMIVAVLVLAVKMMLF